MSINYKAPQLIFKNLPLLPSYIHKLFSAPNF